MEGVGSCNEDKRSWKHMGVQDVGNSMTYIKEYPSPKEDLQHNLLPKETNPLPKITHYPPL